MAKVKHSRWFTSLLPLLPLSKSLLCADVSSVCACVCVCVCVCVLVNKESALRDKFSGLFDPGRILFWPVYVAPQASCETGGWKHIEQIKVSTV